MALADAWRLFKAIERLVESEGTHSRAIQNLKQGGEDHGRRIARLEHREDIVATEARSAARMGASDAMQGVILEIGERLAAMEAKLGIDRAPPPRIATPRKPRKPRP